MKAEHTEQRRKQDQALVMLLVPSIHQHLLLGADTSAASSVQEPPEHFKVPVLVSFCFPPKLCCRADREEQPPAERGNKQLDGKQLNTAEEVPKRIRESWNGWKGP